MKAKKRTEYTVTLSKSEARIIRDLIEFHDPNELTEKARKLRRKLLCVFPDYGE